MAARRSKLTAVVADNVRRVARERGLSLNRLAEVSGVSRSQMFVTLAGEGSPSVEWLAAVADALDVEVAELCAPRGRSRRRASGLPAPTPAAAGALRARAKTMPVERISRAQVAAAENIRVLARRRGLSLNALADRADVSRSQLFALLGLQHGGTVEWLARIAEALEVDVSALVRPSPRSKARKRRR